MKPEVKRYSAAVGTRTITFETGKLASQAGGAVTISLSDAVVFAAATMTRAMTKSEDQAPKVGSRRRRILLGMGALLLIWYAGDSVLAYPHYLAYFNELAGGPRWPNRGYRLLADSNLDWGQDWIRLKKWQDENRVSELAVAGFGKVDPAVFGVHYQKAACPPGPGYLAVSANLVLGLDPFHEGKSCYSFLQKQPPVGYAGPAVWIYRLP